MVAAGSHSTNQLPKVEQVQRDPLVPLDRVLNEKRSIPWSICGDAARDCGLELFSTLSTSILTSSLEAHAVLLESWQKNGYAGEMAYMEREPQLFVSPELFLANVRSVTSILIPYQSRIDGEAPSEPGPGFGRVARYAWGRDYHRVLKRVLRKFVETCEDRVGWERGTIAWRGFSDAVPLLERAVAAEAQLGFAGKNTMLIRPGTGSFFFISEVFWDLDVEPDVAATAPAPKTGCGTCRRCLTSCPTDAFVGPYTLDARKCISYLTIEKRGEFSAWEAEAIGNWVFGCDVCQEVCPYNHRGVSQSHRAEFSAENGAGPKLSLERLLRIRSDKDFLTQFAGTALMRPGREGLIRNACSVVANTRFFEAVPALSSILESDELSSCRNSASSALVRMLPDLDGVQSRQVTAVLERRMIGVESPKVEVAKTTPHAKNS